MRQTYLFAVSHQNPRPLRLVALSGIAVFIQMTMAPLYKRELAIAAAAGGLLSLHFGLVPTALGGAMLLWGTLAASLIREPDNNAGHRAGAEGYDGELIGPDNVHSCSCMLHACMSTILNRG